ncbi:MAG: hypothetical protein WKF43_04285 [Acidimicrobiales bacterium]
MPIHHPSARRYRPLIALVACLLATSLAVAPSAAQDPGPEDGNSGTALKSRYDVVLGAEADLVRQIDASSKRRVDLLSQVSDLTGRIQLVSLELAAAEGRLASATTKERRSRVALTAARRRLTRATDAMQAQAVASYIHGGVGEDADGHGPGLRERRRHRALPLLRRRRAGPPA